jgi:hypothetical protein
MKLSRRFPPWSCRRRLAALVVAGVFLSLATAAQASAYWDFHGYLDGGEHYLKYTNVTPGQYQPVRMSWTVGSHCMRWIRIDSNGSWFDPSICPGGTGCVYGQYDCAANIYVTSIYDRFGCYNPVGLPTVWVNCRATAPL